MAKLTTRAGLLLGTIALGVASLAAALGIRTLDAMLAPATPATPEEDFEWPQDTTVMCFDDAGAVSSINTTGPQSIFTYDEGYLRVAFTNSAGQLIETSDRCFAYQAGAAPATFPDDTAFGISCTAPNGQVVYEGTINGSSSGSSGHTRDATAYSLIDTRGDRIQTTLKCMPK